MRTLLSAVVLGATLGAGNAVLHAQDRPGQTDEATPQESFSLDAAAAADLDLDLASQSRVALVDRFSRRETLLASLTIFLLAVFLGFELITKVPPTLHTPLMSGSNAISGITVVGALLSAGTVSSSWMVPFLGLLAVTMATVNAVGGFAVTHRMLSMFRRR